MTTKKFSLSCTIVNALIMTAIISFTLTIMNNGIHNFSVLPWIRSWMIAFLLVFILSLFLPKWVRFTMSKMIKVNER